MENVKPNNNFKKSRQEMETDSFQIQQRPCVLPILPQIANLPYFTTFIAFRYNSVLKLSPLSLLWLSEVYPFEDVAKGIQFWGRASLINGETAVFRIRDPRSTYIH